MISMNGQARYGYEINTKQSMRCVKVHKFRRLWLSAKYVYGTEARESNEGKCGALALSWHRNKNP